MKMLSAKLASNPISPNAPVRPIGMKKKFRPHVFPTPEDAEAAFYEAFEHGDLDAMMSVWAETDDIVCIHPMAPRLQGREAVIESWRQLFSGDSELVRMKITDTRCFQDELLSIHVVHEHFIVPGEAIQHAPLVVTNIYQLTEKGWRMILHHASPSPDVPSPSLDRMPTHLH